MVIKDEFDHWHCINNLSDEEESDPEDDMETMDKAGENLQKEEGPNSKFKLDV